MSFLAFGLYEMGISDRTRSSSPTAVSLLAGAAIMLLAGVVIALPPSQTTCKHIYCGPYQSSQKWGYKRTCKTAFLSDFNPCLISGVFVGNQTHTFCVFSSVRAVLTSVVVYPLARYKQSLSVLSLAASPLHGEFSFLTQLFCKQTDESATLGPPF